mgnify:CR=1 FL=1
MEKVNFNFYRKKFKGHAKEFIEDQELMLIFLNSPVRLNWMKFVGLKQSDINKIMKIVEYYAKLKIKEENKKKPKTRNAIIKIESDCLRKIFLGRIIKVGGIVRKTERFKIVNKILKSEYKNSVILNPLQLEKLVILAGLSKSDIPTDFLVFDLRNKKIIGIDVPV